MPKNNAQSTQLKYSGDAGNLTVIYSNDTGPNFFPVTYVVFWHLLEFIREKMHKVAKLKGWKILYFACWSNFPGSPERVEQISYEVIWTQNLVGIICLFMNFSYSNFGDMKILLSIWLERPLCSSRQNQDIFVSIHHFSVDQIFKPC